MGHLVKFLGSLYGLPGYVLVALSCAVVGYLCRFCKRCPNDYIPFFVVGWAMVFNPLISAAPAKDSTWRIWLVTHVLIGMVVGLVAWLAHNKILKKFEMKVPVFGAKLEAADARSDAYQASKK